MGGHKKYSYYFSLKIVKSLYCCWDQIAEVTVYKSDKYDTIQ